MKALLIVLLVLLLLGFVKVGIHFVFDEAITIQLLIWKFRISFPKGKEKKSEQQAAPDQVQLKPEKESNPSAKGWVRAALFHWRDILALLGKALHMPALDPLIVRVTAGGSDPADKALNYGRAWAILCGMIPLLENTFRIGRREIDVQCGEDRENFSFYIRIDLTVRIYEILLLAVLGLKLLLKIYQEYQSTKKAVQTT